MTSPAASLNDDPTSWRTGQFRALLNFATPALHPDGGAQWLNETGEPDTTQPIHTWVTARFAHIYSLGHLLGVPDAGEQADRALSGLTGLLQDALHGGWISSRATATSEPTAGHDETKSAYAHAFVVLAASSATVAGRPGARNLLEAALEVLDLRFWDPAEQMHVDEWSRDWKRLQPYRGINANMHAVEALLAAYDATGNRTWLDRALAICDRVIEWAQTYSWRVPEHYDQHWNPVLDFNLDHPKDPFKPFGSTPGHGFEWSRLLIQADAAAGTPGQRTASAVSLFNRASSDGWATDRGGFFYTVDWKGTPVEPRRYHWVAAEAVAAADTLARGTDDPRYAAQALKWWTWINDNLIDHRYGSWHHELDTNNDPAGLTWTGKPDIYHAAQALIIPDLPLRGSLAGPAGGPPPR